MHSSVQHLSTHVFLFWLVKDCDTHGSCFQEGGQVVQYPFQCCKESTSDPLQWPVDARWWQSKDCLAGDSKPVLVVHFKGHFAQSWLSQLTGTVSIFFLIFSVLIKYVKVHLEFVLSELLCCREYIQTSGTFQAHVLAWLESSCSLNYATWSKTYAQWFPACHFAHFLETVHAYQINGVA